MEGKIYSIDPKSAVGEIIDGEAVIINLQTGSYYSADGVGATIWNCIEKQSSHAAIVSEVGAHFDGSRAEHEQGVAEFIQQLLQADLIVEEAGAASEDDSASGTQTNGAGNARKPFAVPTLNTYSDMQDLLLLDPIHDVSDSEGWPVKKAEQ